MRKIDSRIFYALALILVLIAFNEQGTIGILLGVAKLHWKWVLLGACTIAIVAFFIPFHGADKIRSLLGRDIITVGYSQHVKNLTKCSYRHFVTWDELIEQLRLNTIEPLRSNHWIPDLVLCIGRGGAIIGSIIASTLKSDDNRIPIMVLNVVYKNSFQELDTSIFTLVDFSCYRRILLVDSNVQTGTTVGIIRNCLPHIPNEGVRALALVWAPSTPACVPPSYAAYRIDNLHETRVSFPWYIQ